MGDAHRRAEPRLPRRPNTPIGTVLRRREHETWREWNARSRTWRVENRRYLAMARLSAFQHRTLLAGAVICAVLGSTTATGNQVRLPEGIGEALVIDYRSQWRAQYPDCVPHAELPVSSRDPNSLLVVVLDGSPERMTPQEYRERRRAVGSALDQAWPVAHCTRTLPTSG